MRTRRHAATSSTLFCVPAKLAPVHPRFAVYAVDAICSLKSHVPRRRSFGVAGHGQETRGTRPQHTEGGHGGCE